MKLNATTFFIGMFVAGFLVGTIISLIMFLTR